MLKKLLMPAGLLVLFCPAAFASEKPKMTAEEFEASLMYQKGQIILPGGIATLKIPDSFRYLDPKDSERVIMRHGATRPETIKQPE